MAAKQRKEAAKAIVPKFKKSKMIHQEFLWMLLLEELFTRGIYLGVSSSPLTGANSFGDTHKTIDNESLDTNQTAAHETHDEIIKILDQEGDSRLSDGEGEGCEIAQSFLDGMLNVE
jgi:hypothetical protein